MSCRQPAPSRTTRTINAEGAEPAENFSLSARSAGSAFAVRGSVRNGGHLARIERLEEPARVLEVKLRVLRLDAQEESIAAREREARHVEDRVVGHRQPVEREHAEYGRQHRAENRALERHRDERRPAEV